MEQQPPWFPLELPPKPPGGAKEQLRVRRCEACGKFRFLPRHQPETVPFVCAELMDPKRALCSAPNLVWRWDV